MSYGAQMWHVTTPSVPTLSHPHPPPNPPGQSVLPHVPAQVTVPPQEEGSGLQA